MRRKLTLIDLLLLVLVQRQIAYQICQIVRSRFCQSLSAETGELVQIYRVQLQMMISQKH